MHGHHRVLLSGILAKRLFSLWFHTGPQWYWNEVTSKPSGSIAAITVLQDCVSLPFGLA